MAGYPVQPGLLVTIVAFACHLMHTDDQVQHYLTLAERPNTRKSYASAIAHFEQDFRGLLPATVDSIARYLAHYAGELSNATLQQRLAALSAWHREHGFTDPTKDTTVRQVLKGIRTAHNAPQQQARALALAQLDQAVRGLSGYAPEMDDPRTQRATHLRRLRDQAMLLVGFWRGFRADELVRIPIDTLEREPGAGMVLYLPFSKGDRQSAGRRYPVPALSRLCPVSAVDAWIAASGLSSGPLFRAIDRWGNLSESPMATGSIVPWLRHVFSLAGIEAAEIYSSHSLRRGFATWAVGTGWDLKALMEYVGWKDMASALRYLDPGMHSISARLEAGLAQRTPARVGQATSPVRRVK